MEWTRNLQKRKFQTSECRTKYNRVLTTTKFKFKTEGHWIYNLNSPFWFFFKFKIFSL